MDTQNCQDTSEVIQAKEVLRILGKMISRRIRRMQGSQYRNEYHYPPKSEENNENLS